MSNSEGLMGTLMYLSDQYTLGNMSWSEVELDMEDEIHAIYGGTPQFDEAMERAKDFMQAERGSGDALETFLAQPFGSVIKSATGASGGHETHKARLDLIPWDVADEVGAVFGYGERKHPSVDGLANWKLGLPASANLASALRHISKFAQGERIDPESGHPHIAHAICRLMMLQHSLNNDIGEDDLQE